MKTFSQRLGDDLKQYRKARKVSQKEMAARLQTTQPTIVDIERGRTIPRRDVLDRLVAIIYPNFGESNTVREPSTPYHTGKTFVQWINELMRDELPYDEMVRLVRDAADLELARIASKPQQSKESRNAG